MMLCSSYLTQADYSSWFMSDLDPYDQYEVSVPLEIAGTCLTEVRRVTNLASSAHPCTMPSRPCLSPHSRARSRDFQVQLSANAYLCAREDCQLAESAVPCK